MHGLKTRATSLFRGILARELAFHAHVDVASRVFIIAEETRGVAELEVPSPAVGAALRRVAPEGNAQPVDSALLLQNRFGGVWQEILESLSILTCHIVECLKFHRLYRTR